MRKIVLLLCLLAAITVKAQSNEPPSNVIKVSGGLDFVTSKMYLPDYTTGTDKVKATSWKPGVSALVDYEHFWKSGWGFGLNFMYNDTRQICQPNGALAVGSLSEKQTRSHGSTWRKTADQE